LRYSPSRAELAPECRIYDRDGEIMDRVSFDLMVFPPSGPRTIPEVLQLLHAEEQRLIAGTDDARPPFGPEMTQFVDEIRQRWPLEAALPQPRTVC
jgi:hypothetical protein